MLLFRAMISLVLTQNCSKKAEEAVLLSASLSHWTWKSIKNCDVLLQTSLLPGPALQDSSSLCDSTRRALRRTLIDVEGRLQALGQWWLPFTVNRGCHLSAGPRSSPAPFITGPLLYFKGPDWQSDSNNSLHLLKSAGSFTVWLWSLLWGHLSFLNRFELQTCLSRLCVYFLLPSWG